MKRQRMALFMWQHGEEAMAKVVCVDRTTCVDAAMAPRSLGSILHTANIVRSDSVWHICVPVRLDRVCMCLTG